MPVKPFFIALLCLLSVGAAEAQWKWRDAKGNLQYSDMPPPPGTPDKDIMQRPANARPTIIVAPPGQAASDAAAPAPAASSPTRAELEAAARLKREQEGEASKKRDEERRLADQRRENCARAQASLRTLQSGQRLTRTNENGERVYMDQNQLASEVDRARDIITSECR